MCTENWDNQNYPISLELYNNFGGFDNGYVPLFAIVGQGYKVYYNDNYTPFDDQLQQAITEMAPLASPAAIDNFTHIAGGNGALSCDLAWTNPTQTVAGDPLSDIDAVNIYRNNEVIHTFNSATVGGTMSYTDTPTEAGLYMYKVAAVNSEGEGLGTVASVYIGEDTPGMVTDLTLENNGGMADLTWSNPTTGAHDGYYVEGSITSLYNC